MINIYFCEYIDETALSLFKTQPGDIFALTPTACFQLEDKEIEYRIADDILAPTETNVAEVISMLYQASYYSTIFLIPVCHVYRTVGYWTQFFEYYKVDDATVFYFGNEFRNLIGYLEKLIGLKKFHKIEG